MGNVYSPYTKKECIDITAQYFGITKKRAKEYIERLVDFEYKYCPYERYIGAVGRDVAEMEIGLKGQSRLAFLED